MNASLYVTSVSRNVYWFLRYSICAPLYQQHLFITLIIFAKLGRLMKKKLFFVQVKSSAMKVEKKSSNPLSLKYYVAENQFHLARLQKKFFYTSLKNKFVDTRTYDATTLTLLLACMDILIFYNLFRNYFLNNRRALEIGIEYLQV